MARRWDHRFQGFDLHDVQKRNRDEPFGDIVWIFRRSQANFHRAPANNCQLGMHDVVGPTVRERQAEWSKGPASQKFKNILRSHRGPPNLWSPLRTGSLS